MKNAEERKFILTSEECDYIEKLIIKNESVVRSVIRSALGEKFDQIGDECMSDLYLLMCEKIDKLKKHENPDGWLIVSAKNIALNAKRKHNTQLKHMIVEERTYIRAEDNVFENALYNIWLEDGAIDKILARLTPRETEIYNYLYRKRLSCKQTAKITGLSESTVRNINANIKKKIHKGLHKNDF